MDEQHHPDEDRDEDHDEVRAVDELHADDDDEDDRREHRAEAVEAAARQTQPVSRTFRQWMTIPIWLSVKQTNTPTE